MAAGLQPAIAEAIQENATANGLAVIISNNYDRCRTLETLSGTKADGERMKHSLQVLNFSTYHEHNLSKEATMQLLHSVAVYRKFPPSYKRIVFVFSGHGGSDHRLYTGDGETVNMLDIVSAFFPERAPLNGSIAKLFFIDACRGKEANTGVLVPRGGKEMEALITPQEGNFLLAYSTTPNHLSYEERANGGIWITTLAEKLCHTNASVLDVLVEVNQHLIMKYQKSSYARFIQQPELISRLNEPINLFREAQEAVKILTFKKASDEEKVGRIFLDPKIATTRSLPVSLSLGSKIIPEHQMWTASKNGNSFSGSSNGCAPSPCATTTNTYTDVLMRSQGGSPKEKLEKYCSERGKPKPHFQVDRVDGKRYRATVYVAKTCGRLTGNIMESKWDAEMNAAKHLLRKLKL